MHGSMLSSTCLGVLGVCVNRVRSVSQTPSASLPRLLLALNCPDWDTSADIADVSLTRPLILPRAAVPWLPTHATLF